nr:ATP-binding protein [Bacillus massiliigorillae]
MQFLSVSVLLLHGIYTLIIFLFFVRKKEFLYLFIAFICVALSVLIDDDRIIIYLFPGISYKWWMILYYFSYLSSVYFLLQFVKSLRDKKIDEKSYVRVVANIYQILYFIFLICILVDPFKKESMFGYAIILYFGLMLGLWYVFKGVSIARKEFLFYFWATICVTSSYLWGAMRVIGIVDYFPYYPLDIIIGVITFSTYWFKRFFDTSKKNNELASELQAIDKKREEFLANTSHELRNPLHGIMNIVQTVYESEKNQLNAENKQNLQLLMRVSQRMSLILNDLLDITKLKDGSIKLQMGQVNLLSVVLNVFDTLRFMTEGKDIKFIIHDSELFLIVRADENRLFQIIFNLVHNAVKYTNYGKIIISCDVRDGEAFIKVEDTGIGMDEVTIESIFEPYKQADSSMTSIAGGIGLGLSICDQLVKLHGGVLSVSSTLGKGSIFMFTLQTIPTEEQLPLESIVMFDDVKEQLERVKEPTKLNEDVLKVLVVDDDSINLQILETILEAETFNVVTCTSGKEALELLDKGNWDLVITDVMMPYMSGYELTQKIRERFKISELPILLLTARSHFEGIQAGFYYGANDYVMKPVEKLELTARVRSLTQLKLSINERVRMEAAWLQAQIQPHFLFNTFNTIAALSEVNPSKMIDLLTEFDNYLRASFDMQNLNPVVPLQHELDLVQSYIYIQQERFRDRLKVEWDIDDKLDAQVPPLTIQTIVENAINHGVLKRSNGGTVRIGINHQQQGVLISIVDNGVGMTENQLQELLTYPLNEQQGIGLLNTDKRLKQLYGSGLIIQSVLNEGTAVSFFIPKGE